MSVTNPPTRPKKVGRGLTQSTNKLVNTADTYLIVQENILLSIQADVTSINVLATLITKLYYNTVRLLTILYIPTLEKIN